MTILTFLSSLSQVVAFALYFHPIHVTVTEIEYDEKDKALEIMMRVFIDDFELSLREELNQPELDILNPNAGQTTDQLAGAYLNKHFRILLDNKIQKANYLGHEREADAFIFYIEVPNVRKWKTIQVQNDVLTALHEDQSNLVHVTVKGEVKSLRLTRNTPQDKITFGIK